MNIGGQQDIDALRLKVRELGPWFHQIDLGSGVRTRDIAPLPGPQALDHPRARWEVLKDIIPMDLRGKNVLDIGCAEGFFALEMARRGAEVRAIDAAPRMIARLQWLIEYFEINNVRTEVNSIESLANSTERYDFVLMIALLYHLRSPQIGLDIVHRLSDTVYIESALHDSNEDAYLYLQPPIEGVHSIPKWMPTEKCVLSMLHFAGFDQVDILQRVGKNRGIYVAKSVRK